MRRAALIVVLLASASCVKEKDVDPSRLAFGDSSVEDAQGSDARIIAEAGWRYRDGSAAADSAITKPDAAADSAAATDSAITKPDAAADSATTKPDAAADSAVVPSDASVPDATDPCSHMCTGSTGKMFCLGELGTQACRTNGMDGLKTCTCASTGWTRCSACFLP